MLNSKLYDRLKFLSLIGIPAFIVAYSTIAELWELPKTKEVAGTLAAIGLLLGALLRISSNKYAEAHADENMADEVGSLAVTGYDDLTGAPDLRLTVDPDAVNAAGGDYVKVKFNREVEPTPIVEH